MSIVSSTYAESPSEIDGRKHITELHTDSVGVVHHHDYLAHSGANYSANMNAYAVALVEVLAIQEAASLVNGGA